MKTDEFIKTIERYKQRLFISNVGWLIIVLAMAGVLFLQLKKYNEKNLVVIADNGRFLANQVPSETVYYFDVKNFAKVIIKSFYEYDQENFRDKVEEGSKLVDKDGYKKIEKSLIDAGIKKALAEKGVKTKVDIDSIKVRDDLRPLLVECFLKHNIIQNDQIVKFNTFGLTFEVNNTLRNDANPYGLQAINVNYINYNITNTNGLTEEQIEVLRRSNQIEVK